MTTTSTESPKVPTGDPQVTMPGDLQVCPECQGNCACPFCDGEPQEPNGCLDCHSTGDCNECKGSGYV